MAEKLLSVLSSLRLTVVCLVFALVLVFVGTLAQVHEGLYQAQERFFKSWVIVGLSYGPDMKIPMVLPGGYLLGTVLLANLLAAHFKRFKFTRKKTGIFLVHAGLILLLLGQLLTDLLSTESAMRLAEGEARNYSQDFRANELALVDTTDPNHDDVVVIPESLVAAGGDLRHEKLPFTVRVKQFWPNIADLVSEQRPGAVPSGATEGMGRGLYVLPAKPALTMEERNLPGALIELVGPKASLGTWLVTSASTAKQEFRAEGRSYHIALRFTRYYKPYSISLVDFRHDKYKGTEIPKNFSSRIRIQRPERNEDREVLIYMNNPLRYEGETYYQAGFDEKDPTVTILQVVRNPSWLTPYFACVMVSAGLVVQFLMHLVGFATKRRNA